MHMAFLSAFRSLFFVCFSRADLFPSGEALEDRSSASSTRDGEDSLVDDHVDWLCALMLPLIDVTDELAILDAGELARTYGRDPREYVDVGLRVRGSGSKAEFNEM